MDASTNNNMNLIEGSNENNYNLITDNVVLDSNQPNEKYIDENEMQHSHEINIENELTKKYIYEQRNECDNYLISDANQDDVKDVVDDKNDDDEDLNNGNSSQEINSRSESIASPVSSVKSIENQNREVTPKIEKSNMSELLSKLAESSSALSSSSSSSCVNSSGIGSTDLSPHIEYELSRSPSSDTYLSNQQHQTQLGRKRDGSVASQGSCSSSSTRKFLDNKDGMGFLMGNNCGSSSSSTSGKKSRKEVIPQRKRRDFIPNELKDESYWERRRKNNLAAKRSREKRRLNDIVLETKVLELTNLNNIIKLKLDLCQKKYDINEDEINKLFEENKHMLVVQETLDMSELLTNEDSTHPFDNDNEFSAASYLSSSSSTSSSKRKSYGKEDINSSVGGLLISSMDSVNHITHSSKVSPDISCSISTSSSHHIGSSGRSNSSSVDDVDCDGFNDAISENGLEIDENLDTIVESTDDNNEKKTGHDKAEIKKSDDFLGFINRDGHDLNDEESSSPPSKRKSFFNPTHTSSCPSKSPSPTLIRTPNSEDQMDNNLSLSPIDPYTTSPKQHKAIKTNEHFDSEKNCISENKKSESADKKPDPAQMKSQYPLLYNQLCKNTNAPNLSPIKKQAKQSMQSNETSTSYSLEKQNQLLLTRILNQNNGANASNSNNPLMKTILNEILLRNEFSKQNGNNTNTPNTSTNNTNNQDISISSLLKQSETSSSKQNNDILTKILSSAMPSNNASNSSNTLMERLGYLLKSSSSASNSQVNQKPQSSASNQANALMEKYKNLINKTNNNTQSQSSQKFPQQKYANTNTLASNHSSNKRSNTDISSQNIHQKSVPISSKNTVNNLLQSFSTQANNSHSMQTEQKAKNSSSSRKRHLNQSEKNETKDLGSLLNNNPDLLAFVNSKQHQTSNESLNELVAMMLAAQQNTQNFQNTRQSSNGSRGQANYPNINGKNSNSAKNQTYNQLLALHQNQKLQQRQHEALLGRNIQSQAYTQDDLNHLNSPHDQFSQLQASQLYYQQQQGSLNKNDMNANNSANNNNANGDNMPLKLRFKMLQLKTGEVN